MSKKTFTDGQSIDFQRDTQSDWEPGNYLRPDPTAPGWHWVMDNTGWACRHYVPTKRIRSKS